MPRVALYARYSSDLQNPRSVDDQFLNQSQESLVALPRDNPKLQNTTLVDAAT